MQKLLEKIDKVWSNSDQAEHEREVLKSGTTEDKCAVISGLYGIFDASMKGNIYTYYFWTSDVDISNIYNYHGKTRERKWRELAECYRVDYNIDTDEATVTKQERWNKRCTENQYRIL